MDNPKKKINKLYVIVYVILLIFLIYNVSLIVQSFVYPNKTPSFLGIKTYVIVSGSMQPELNIGDIAIVKETDSLNLKERDIISFREGESVVTHRIEQLQLTDTEIKYQTKGDNNNTVDQHLVESSNIEGKMIAKIPYLGYVLIFLQNKYVIIAIISIYYILTFKSFKKN